MVCFCLCVDVSLIVVSSFLTSTSSAGVLIYGWAIFQKRVTMISARDSGNFGKFGDSFSDKRLP